MPHTESSQHASDAVLCDLFSDEEEQEWPPLSKLSGVTARRRPQPTSEGSHTMGQTVEKVKVQNFEDILKARRGEISENEIRTVEFDALMDSGAAYLCLPPAEIDRLGLPYAQTRKVKTANGAVERRIFMGGHITIKDRSEQMSVMENDETTPPLIGYLVLEALDFVVDPRSQQLIGNPQHDGKWITDLY